MTTSTISPEFTAALDALVPAQTAGSLPGTRTFDMVTSALESENVERLSLELQHSRAHYQSLEYMLNDESAVFTALSEAIENGQFPTPTTPAEAIKLTIRAYSTELMGAAYDNAHMTGFFVGVLGQTVQQALEQIYHGLDFSDPERELSDEDLVALTTPATPAELDD